MKRLLAFTKDDILKLRFMLYLLVFVLSAELMSWDLFYTFIYPARTFGSISFVPGFILFLGIMTVWIVDKVRSQQWGWPQSIMPANNSMSKAKKGKVGYALSWGLMWIVGWALALIAFFASHYFAAVYLFNSSPSEAALGIWVWTMMIAVLSPFLCLPAFVVSALIGTSDRGAALVRSVMLTTVVQFSIVLIFKYDIRF